MCGRGNRVDERQHKGRGQIDFKRAIEEVWVKKKSSQKEDLFITIETIIFQCVLIDTGWKRKSKQRKMVGMGGNERKQRKIQGGEKNSDRKIGNFNFFMTI